MVTFFAMIGHLGRRVLQPAALTFAWCITEGVEEAHAHERRIGFVVRNKGAMYSDHHGKPYQIFRKLFLGMLLLLCVEEFSLSGISNE